MYVSAGRSVRTFGNVTKIAVVRRKHRFVQEMGHRPLVLFGSDCRLVSVDAGMFNVCPSRLSVDEHLIYVKEFGYLGSTVDESIIEE